MTAIPLSRIRLDGGTQPRAVTDVTLIDDYAEAMAAGARFPPLIVFSDGVDYWLADGFHRHGAFSIVAEHMGVADPVIECDIRGGSQRDAVLFSCGANAVHGVRRTNKDKRRAVKRLLGDPEWSQWSDHEIAKACNVHHTFVLKLRPKVLVTTDITSEPKTRKYRDKHGTESEMNVKGIGKGKANGKAAKPAKAAKPKAAPKWDWLFDHVRAIDEAVTALPAPDVVVRNFPAGLAGVMTGERAKEISRWWQEFTRLWCARQSEFDNFANRQLALIEEATNGVRH